MKWRKLSAREVALPPNNGRLTWQLGAEDIGHWVPRLVVVQVGPGSFAVMRKGPGLQRGSEGSRGTLRAAKDLGESVYRQDRAQAEEAERDRMQREREEEDESSAFEGMHDTFAASMYEGAAEEAERDRMQREREQEEAPALLQTRKRELDQARAIIAKWEDAPAAGVLAQPEQPQQQHGSIRVRAGTGERAGKWVWSIHNSRSPSDRSLVHSRVAPTEAKALQRAQAWAAKQKHWTYTFVPETRQLGAKPMHSQSQSHEARELTIHAANNEDLWNRRRPEFLKNSIRRKLNGTYDSEKAAKLWEYFADEVAKSYTREYGNGVGFGIFTKAQRREAAQEFRDDFENEWDFGGFHTHNPELFPKGATTMAKKKAKKKSTRKKPRTAAQKRATAKLIAANKKKAKKRTKKKATKKKATKKKATKKRASKSSAKAIFEAAKRKGKSKAARTVYFI